MYTFKNFTRNPRLFILGTYSNQPLHRFHLTELATFRLDRWQRERCNWGTVISYLRLCMVIPSKGHGFVPEPLACSFSTASPSSTFQRFQCEPSVPEAYRASYLHTFHLVTAVKGHSSPRMQKPYALRHVIQPVACEVFKVQINFLYKHALSEVSTRLRSLYYFTLG